MDVVKLNGALAGSVTGIDWDAGPGADDFEQIETALMAHGVLAVAAALRKADFDEEETRARSASVHDYLLGAMVRNMVQPIERAELAKTVSAISGVDFDPIDC